MNGDPALELAQKLLEKLQEKITHFLCKHEKKTRNLKQRNNCYGEEVQMKMNDETSGEILRSYADQHKKKNNEDNEKEEFAHDQPKTKFTIIKLNRMAIPLGCW